MQQTGFDYQKTRASISLHYGIVLYQQLVFVQKQLEILSIVESKNS